MQPAAHAEEKTWSSQIPLGRAESFLTNRRSSRGERALHHVEKCAYLPSVFAEWSDRLLTLET